VDLPASTEDHAQVDVNHVGDDPFVEFVKQDADS
jgi:hypothetical protein